MHMEINQLVHLQSQLVCDKINGSFYIASVPFIYYSKWRNSIIKALKKYLNKNQFKKHINNYAYL